MTALAAALAGAAVACALARPRVAGRRLDRLATRVAGRAGRRPLSSQLACSLAGLGVAGAVGGVAGLVIGGAVAALGPRAVARLEPAAARRERLRLQADAPVLLDLLAACLSAGATPESAAEATASALGGAGGVRLRRVSAALCLGAPRGQAWLELGGDDPDDPLAAAARLLARAAESGTPAAAAVARLAVDARAASQAAAAAAIRRVGVLVVAPLGLCFLPAFVLLGIVPVVAGLVGPLLATF